VSDDAGELPTGPDGSELTPEEWDAVRRLRGERAAAEPAPVVEPHQTPQAQETPQAPETPQLEETPEPAATAAPLEPVEPVPPPAETAPPVARSVGRAAPVAVPALAALMVLAVVSVVLAALVGLRVSDHHTRDKASTSALAAATTGVATVLSYNYRSLDADFSKAEALLTSSFRKAYVSTTAKAVQPLAAKYKAVSTAQVSAAGVISASASKATVLVFVSQQVTNTQLSAPRLDRSRIQVDLVHSHGRWLINKLTPV
jgi:Mce-associated membrane protein